MDVLKRGSPDRYPVMHDDYYKRRQERSWSPNGHVHIVQLHSVGIEYLYDVTAWLGERVYWQTLDVFPSLFGVISSICDTSQIRVPHHITKTPVPVIHTSGGGGQIGGITITTDPHLRGWCKSHKVSYWLFVNTKVNVTTLQNRQDTHKHTSKNFPSKTVMCNLSYQAEVSL